MLRSIFVLLLSVLSGSSFAQETRVYTDPMQAYLKAREHFQEERYSLAYPMFRDLQQSLRETDRVNRQLSSDEIDFYTTACALRRNEPGAEAEARTIVDAEGRHAVGKKMAFHLAEYHYRNEDFRSALSLYELTDVEQLSNREIGDMKFHEGYAHFTLDQYAKAKPSLQAVRQLTDHPNHMDAHYYYGFICYSERRYSEALDAFRKVEDHPQYRKAVPFYIANILYSQGQKDKALAYAESGLSKAPGQRSNEMNLFLGHAYFEKKQFGKALPFLEASSKGPEKLTRGQLYELSFCYYEAGRYADAADGFSQLSNGTDSLTQSAMYLLGDAYLKTGRKPDARNAFAYCASNSSIPLQREVSAFNYAKLSYELGYQDIALTELRKFIGKYPASTYNREARELLVALLANTNNYREALSVLEGISAPTDATRKLYPKVAYGRAMELVNDQQLSAAEALLDKVLKDPYNTAVAAPARFWKGEIAYRTGRIDEALRSFNDYTAMPAANLGDANLQHARYHLGYAQLRKENYASAQGYFEQVAKGIRANSGAVEQDAYMREADCRFMLRDFSGAKSIYDKVIGYGWASSDYAYYQLAMIAGVSKPTEKITILNGFERRYPASELVQQANMELAATYLSEERYKDAVPLLNNIVRSNASALKPRAYLRLGIAHYNLNNNREALENYRKLVTGYPGAPEVEDALESARAIFVEEGRTAEYADFLRSAGRSISRNQEDSLAWSVAETRYADKDINGAVKAIDEYMVRFPDGAFTTDAHFIRAEAYNQRKDWKNAAADYEAVADRGPGKYAEKACQQAGRINYFELKDYEKSERYFTILKSLTNNREAKLDAMRGLLRSQYQLRKWNDAVPNAQELLREKSISTDDKVLATMVQARSMQSNGKFAEAIPQYRSVVTLNGAAYAAEARYEIAECHFRLKDMKNAEKAAMETINKSGSYDFWITKAYILVGDVFREQKDYFNAKATLQSVMENSRNEELKEEAKVKLELVMEEEKKNSRLSDK